MYDLRHVIFVNKLKASLNSVNHGRGLKTRFARYVVKTKL